MKYFIDIESTNFFNAYTNKREYEIISIGVVSESGDEYYSLVKAHHKVTPYIEKLTGITNESLTTAKTIEEVLQGLGEFVSKENNGEFRGQFYVYGSEDCTFLMDTLKQMYHRRSSVHFLEIILYNLYDHSTEVQKKLKLTNLISLKKALEFYTGEELTQDHNALSDAKMLKQLYELSESKEMPEAIIAEKLADYRKETNRPRHIFQYDAEGNFIREFKSMQSVYKWLIAYQFKNKPKSSFSYNTARNKLKKILDTDETYFGFLWKREVKHG